MSQIYVGCELEYVTASPTSFLFQINAAQTNRQSTINESLSVSPGIAMAALAIGLQANMAQRCFAQPGSFRLHYEATVQLTPDVGPPQTTQAATATA